jgi:hypothetical protein
MLYFQLTKLFSGQNSESLEGSIVTQSRASQRDVLRTLHRKRHAVADPVVVGAELKSELLETFY